MKNISHCVLLILSLPILFLTAAAGWRVDVFQMEDAGGSLIFQSPVSLGHTFTTRYIHSVELTPVEDEYKIAKGLLWTWEERVRSTNAGLPFDKPKYGRFMDNGEWMIFQGGRMSWKEYYYRVGNKNIGRNFERFSVTFLRSVRLISEKGGKRKTDEHRGTLPDIF